MLAIILLCSCTLFAQKNNKKIEYYKVWITPIDGSKSVIGYLYSADEQTVKIIDNISLNVSIKTEISAKKIDVIKIRRKGKIGRSMLIGGGSGVLTGVAIGFIQGDDDNTGLIYFEKEAYAVGYGFFLGIIGTGVGAGVGSIKKKFLINGDIDIYKQNLNLLKGYSVESNLVP